jgi:predicted dehydrogenase
VARLTPLIAGFGHAGRDLHLPCLVKASECDIGRQFFATSPWAIADPSADLEFGNSNPTIRAFRSLKAAANWCPERTVVHICTPPESHFDTIVDALNLGFRKLIVEKPLVTEGRQLESLHALHQALPFDLIVVSPWLFSAVTRQLKRLVKQHGVPMLFRMHQAKSRTDLTSITRTHQSAFHIELPHQLALAVHLFGDGEVIAARSWDMLAGGRTYPLMGGAEIHLLHKSSTLSILSSNLVSSVRLRSATLDFGTALVTAEYPRSGSESHSQCTVDVTGHAPVVTSWLDDPLTEFMVTAYRLFETGEPISVGDFRFSRRVQQLLFDSEAEATVTRLSTN